MMGSSVVSNSDYTGETLANSERSFSPRRVNCSHSRETELYPYRPGCIASTAGPRHR